MKNNYILVTGGAGYIGSHVVNILIKKGFKVIIIDNLYSGKKNFINKKAKFFKLNLLNKKKILHNLKNFNITAIIHLASYIDVEESEKNPKKYLIDNLLMTKNIMDVLKIKKIKNIIFSSTAAVYGDSKKIKVNENDKIKPISNYGLGKYFCEELIKKYSLNNNINYLILRYFNVVGCNYKSRIGPTKSGSLFKNLSKNVIDNRYELKVYGGNFKTKDGSATRDFIDVVDLANLHYLFLKKIKMCKNIIINCGYAKPNSVIEIVKHFSKTIKKDIKIKIVNKREADIGQIYADNSKLLKFFPNWKPIRNIRQSIDSCLKWERYIKKNKIN